MDHLVVQLGPKMEFFHTNSQDLSLIQHVDASFSLFAIKSLNENWEAKVGLVKRDFTSKFEVEVLDPVTEQRETYFERTAFPAYTSYMLQFGAQYKQYLDQNTLWYAGAGIMLYAQKKLSRTGLETQTDILYDQDQLPISSLEMRSFGNSFQEGNYILKLEAGLVHAVNSYLAIDGTVYASGSSLTHQSLELEFLDSQGNMLIKDELRTQGLGLGLNIGVRIKLQNSKSE